MNTNQIPMLPATETRCLAHGQPAGGKGLSFWCDRRDECARHVSIRTDPFNGTLAVQPRLCQAGGQDYFIPLNQEKVA